MSDKEKTVHYWRVFSGIKTNILKHVIWYVTTSASPMKENGNFCHMKTNFKRDHWKQHFQSQPSLSLAVNQ